jgi:hypothetical protein
MRENLNGVHAEDRCFVGGFVHITTDGKVRTEERQGKRP